MPGNQQRYFALVTSFDPLLGEMECGASIIGKGVVLTAAQCVVDENRTPYDVYVTVFSDKQGIGSTWNGTLASINTAALDVAIPDAYHPAQADWKDQYYGDIALIRVDPEVTHSYVSLPENEEESTGPIMIVSGMGMDEMQEFNSKLEFASVVKRLQVPVYSGLEIEKDHFVAMDLSANLTQDACLGDSGGPLVIPSKYWNVSDPDVVVQSPNLPENDVIVGIVSYGDGEFECGQSGSFGVYTDVFYWKDWIANQINGWS